MIEMISDACRDVIVSTLQCFYWHTTLVQILLIIKKI